MLDTLYRVHFRSPDKFVILFQYMLNKTSLRHARGLVVLSVTLKVF